MHSSSLKKKNHFVAKDSLILSNTISRRNIILHCTLSLNFCVCLVCKIYQWNYNQLENRKHFSWKINIFIFSFKFKGFFSSYLQITIITIIM